jgi:cation diffusion facilitator family transporter
MTISGGRQRTEESGRSASLRRLASWLSLGTAAVLVVVKFAAWLMTGSVALLTSAVSALVEVGASAVTIVGVRYAERPADPEHRFGRGKAEAVAAFMQGLLLSGAAVVLWADSVQRMIKVLECYNRIFDRAVIRQALAFRAPRCALALMCSGPESIPTDHR